MAKADLSCMSICVWVHHMHVDLLFDFLNKRVEKAPDYYLSPETVPNSVTGG